MDTVKVEFTNGTFDVPRDLIAKSDSMSWMLEDDSVIKVPFEYDSAFVVHPFQVPIPKIRKFFKLVSYLDNLEYLYLIICYAKIKLISLIDIDIQTNPDFADNDMVKLINNRRTFYTPEEFIKLEPGSIAFQYAEIISKSWIDGTVAYYGLYDQEMYSEFQGVVLHPSKILRRIVAYIPEDSLKLDVLYDPDDFEGMSNRNWICDALKEQNPDHVISGTICESLVNIADEETRFQNLKSLFLGNSLLLPIFLLRPGQLEPVYELFKILKRGPYREDNNTITYAIESIIENPNRVSLAVSNAVDFILTNFYGMSPSDPQYQVIHFDQSALWREALINILDDPEARLGGYQEIA